VFVYGIGYSLSSDLVNWAPISFVREQPLPFFPPCSAASGAIASPSINDHADAATNFGRPSIDG